jgi:hypothetical protein
VQWHGKSPQQRCPSQYAIIIAAKPSRYSNLSLPTQFLPSARSLDPPPPPLLQVDVMPSAPIHDSHPARLQAWTPTLRPLLRVFMR